MRRDAVPERDAPEEAAGLKRGDAGTVSLRQGQVYGNASAGDACVELEFPYLKNSKRFWYFELNGERWLHKNNCVSAEVADGMLKLKVPAKIANKHGLVC